MKPRYTTFLFPTTIIALNLGAAIVCATNRDWRRMMYWLFAAGLTATVTY